MYLIYALYWAKFGFSSTVEREGDLDDIQTVPLSRFWLRRLRHRLNEQSPGRGRGPASERS